MRRFSQLRQGAGDHPLPLFACLGIGQDHDLVLSPSWLPSALGEAMPLRYLTGMPPRVTSSADLNAAIERVTPDILALLADGVSRDEVAIIAALASQHPKHDVRLTLMRLDVLGQLEMQGGCYVLPAAEAEQG